MLPLYLQVNHYGANMDYAYFDMLKMNGVPPSSPHPPKGNCREGGKKGQTQSFDEAFRQYTDCVQELKPCVCV